MLTAKNLIDEFLIQKAKLKHLNATTCIESLILNSQKSILFFNSNHKYVEFLHLPHPITTISYNVKFP